MIFNSRLGHVGDRRQLISPLITISQSTKLQFSYYMSRKQSDGGSLKLFQITKLRTPVDLMFDSSMSADSYWQRAIACLPSGSYYLAFEATMEYPVVSDIAIDSIRILTNEPCVDASIPTTSNNNGTRAIANPSFLIFA